MLSTGGIMLFLPLVGQLLKHRDITHRPGDRVLSAIALLQQSSFRDSAFVQIAQ